MVIADGDGLVAILSAALGLALAPSPSPPEPGFFSSFPPLSISLLLLLCFPVPSLFFFYLFFSSLVFF